MINKTNGSTFTMIYKTGLEPGSDSVLYSSISFSSVKVKILSTSASTTLASKDSFSF